VTSSTSSSSRRGALAAVAGLCLAASSLACAGHARTHAPGELRVALLPVYNLTGSTAPTRELASPLAMALARAGLDVVEGEPVEEYLSRHRLRFTGGIDGAAAAAAREELGVDALVLTSLELYSTNTPPKLAITIRLVSADPDPVVLWMDGAFLTGDDSPGLLGLGRISKVEKLVGKALSQLARSAGRAAQRGFPSVQRCPTEGRFRPDIAFAAPRLDAKKEYSVAVLPFTDHSGRRGAGELVALQFVHQLAAVPGLHVVEPGVVRDRVIRNRIVALGGASRATARVLRGAMDAELIVSGSVMSFSETGTAGVPTVEFDVSLIETRSGEVVWESTSKSRGDEGVLYAKIGQVNTASDLACRMARDVADEIARGVRARPGAPGDPRLAPFDASSLR
jgi:TolB-like protein